MRPSFTGPTSSSRNWQATYDPGTASPNSDSPGYQVLDRYVNNPTASDTNTLAGQSQQPLSAADGEKKSDVKKLASQVFSSR
ncbi:unnamed protein product [Didymodactylos carnosus]|uniref:Uncharacterized protein n=1 Tax=Didymodactylos carnosus TaxID=1234261 RepID=A0A814WCM4_9BILA|nr:unnamed protein product [Didymodactylos carnosus]CAF3966675.1 unnamed protein product [Didymodactylos carnosus]